MEHQPNFHSHLPEFIIPFFSGSISFVSSLYLIRTIIQKGRHDWSSKPREQLLFGLSILDCCSSLGFAFSTTPAPRWIPSSYRTYGNDTTCTLQGFLVQLGVFAPLYNAFICLNFLLQIKYNVSETYIMKYILPVLHGIVTILSLGMAMFLLVMDWYGFAGVLGCWVEAEDMRDRCHCDYSVIASSPQRREEYLTSDNYVGLTSILVNAPERRSGLKNAWGCYGKPICDHNWYKGCGKAMNSNATYCEECLRCPGEMSESSSLPYPSPALSSSLHYKQHYVHFFLSIPIALGYISVIVLMILLHRTVQKIEGGHHRRGGPALARTVTETGLLYSIAMLLTFTPTALVQVFRGTGDSLGRDVLRILQVSLLPLQGFFNMLIYTSPRWLPIVKSIRICTYLKQGITSCVCGCCYYMLCSQRGAPGNSGGSGRRQGTPTDTKKRKKGGKGWIDKISKMSIDPNRHDVSSVHRTTTSLNDSNINFGIAIKRTSDGDDDVGNDDDDDDDDSGDIESKHTRQYDMSSTSIGSRQPPLKMMSPIEDTEDDLLSVHSSDELQPVHFQMLQLEIGANEEHHSPTDANNGSNHNRQHSLHEQRQPPIPPHPLPSEQEIVFHIIESSSVSSSWSIPTDSDGSSTDTVDA